jgi:hypothetical protein
MSFRACGEEFFMFSVTLYELKKAKDFALVFYQDK